MIWRAAPASTRVDLVHEPGDFCVSSSEWQFDAESKGAAWFSVLVIPHVALSPLLAGGRLARPFRLSAASPLGSLMGTAITAANIQVPLLSDELGEAVLRNLSGLVALACGASEEGAEEGRRSLRASQLAAVKRHVDLHLADPDLTPASVALAFGISSRQLHRLFEPTGISFARYVSRHRLLKCRDAVAGATGTGRSIVDIAFGWGFNSMATFYRAFTNEFGGRAGRLPRRIAPRRLNRRRRRSAGAIVELNCECGATGTCPSDVLQAGGNAGKWRGRFSMNSCLPQIPTTVRCSGTICGFRASKLMTMLALLVYNLHQPDQVLPAIPGTRHPACPVRCETRRLRRAHGSAAVDTRTVARTKTTRRRSATHGRSVTTNSPVR